MGRKGRCPKRGNNDPRYWCAACYHAWLEYGPSVFNGDAANRRILNRSIKPRFDVCPKEYRRQPRSSDTLARDQAAAGGAAAAPAPAAAAMELDSAAGAGSCPADGTRAAKRPRVGGGNDDDEGGGAAAAVPPPTPMVVDNPLDTFFRRAPVEVSVLQPLSPGAHEFVFGAAPLIVKVPSSAVLVIDIDVKKCEPAARTRARVDKYIVDEKTHANLLRHIPLDSIMTQLSTALGEYDRVPGPKPRLSNVKRKQHVALKWSNGYFVGEVSRTYDNHPLGYTHELHYHETAISREEKRDHDLDELPFVGAAAKDGDAEGSWLCVRPKAGGAGDGAAGAAARG